MATGRAMGGCWLVRGSLETALKTWLPGKIEPSKPSEAREAIQARRKENRPQKKEDNNQIVSKHAARQSFD